jgi:hypothetical protein
MMNERSEKDLNMNICELTDKYADNSVVTDFLIDWIGSKGFIRKGHAEELEVASNTLATEDRPEFADLVTAIYLVFANEKARLKVAKRLDPKNNAADAKAARVAAFVEKAGEGSVEAAVAASDKAKKDFVDRNFRA